MSRYSRQRIEARLHLFAIDGAHRIFGVSRMPLQLHSSPSRFSDGRSGFSVMYAALSFETSIVETLVRVDFTRPSGFRMRGYRRTDGCRSRAAFRGRPGSMRRDSPGMIASRGVAGSIGAAQSDSG
jgi:hypothetical protein